MTRPAKARKVDELRAYLQILHAAANAAAPAACKLVLASYGEDPNTGRTLPAFHAHFTPGDVEGMAEQAEKWGAIRHRNVYCGWSLLSPALPTGRKGSERDVLGVLALVCDFDAKNDPRAGDYAARLPLPADFVTETSSGSFQAVYLLSEAATPANAKAVAEALAERTGCDKVTKDMSHVWRPAGSLNYPNAAKIAAGRDPEPFLTRFVKPWDGKSRTDLADLRRAVSVAAAPPALLVPPRQGVPLASSEDTSKNPPPRAVPATLRAELERAPTPGEDRSKTAFGVIKALQDLGYSAEQTAATISEHPDGIGQRYAGSPDKLRRDVERIFGKVPAWLTEMNQRFFVVNESGRALVYRPTVDPVLRREVLERLAFEDMRKLFLNERVTVGHTTDKGTGESRPVSKNKAEAWLSHPHRRQYLGGVVFAPGQTVPPDTLNLWRGFGVQSKAGDWSRMQAHIRDVVCASDETLFTYVLGWMARAVQLPGEQGEVALVLRGGKGTGKGTLGHALARIFGQHGLYITNGKHLTGQFNAHLRDAVFVFADEAFFAGDRSHESVLKGLVTDPLLTIEGKYQTAVTARNVTHIFMASNDSWVVPASADERRFCVLDVSDKHQQDRPYFKALHAEMAAGGLEAMLHDLLAYDLSGFDVRDVPETAALADQKTQSLRGPEAWLYDCLQRGEIGTAEWTEQGLTVKKTEAYDHYRQRAADYGDYRPRDIQEWAKIVKKVLSGCWREGRPRRQAGAARPRELLFDSLSACRLAFEAHIGAAREWETEAADAPFEPQSADDLFS